ncbi:MAG: hypothetical protein ACRD7E_02665 [Bryobacteraceae bacterium]
MRKSFRNVKLQAGLARDPRVVARVVLGALLVANLIAAFAVFRPFGGSVEELENRITSLQQQVQQRQASLQRVRLLVSKIEKGRAAGDQFLSNYFMDRKTASSSLVSELLKSSRDAGIRMKEHAVEIEPIEGSNSLSMMTITANYEGTYGDLLQFVNRLDRSQRFFILDSLRAAPQPGSGNLSVNVKLNAFIREDLPAS